MEDIIKKMVHREIREILAESREDIKGIVRTSLIPQLRTAIRKEITQILDELHVKGAETFVKPVPTSENHPDKSIPSPALNNSEIRNPKSEIGLYLYCIADESEAVNFGGIGIDGSEVYSIPFRDLSAVVHDCTAEPYQSDNPEKVKEWVLTHQQVLDGAVEKFGTVIPMGFDTIICGKGDSDPQQNMKEWMENDYDNLTLKMTKIRGKAEYGVQIFWEAKTMAHRIGDESPEMKKLREEIRTKPKGIAYMYRQKLEELLKTEMGKRADQCFQEFYEKIAKHVDELRVEKTRKAEDEGRQMLLNVSCLLSGGQREELGEALEEIDNREGFSVRYTGPWPPYSFV